MTCPRCLVSPAHVLITVALGGSSGSSTKAKPPRDALGPFLLSRHQETQRLWDLSGGSLLLTVQGPLPTSNLNRILIMTSSFPPPLTPSTASTLPSYLCIYREQPSPLPAFLLLESSHAFPTSLCTVPGLHRLSYPCASGITASSCTLLPTRAAQLLARLQRCIFEQESRSPGSSCLALTTPCPLGAPC